MDDHKVKRFISLAGLQNGQFIGPDKVEVSIANNAVFLTMLVPDTMFNYSAYGPEDYYGKMQKDYVLYSIENPDSQYTYSQFNVNRWPQFGSFSTANFFLPVYNNVNQCLPGNDQCIYDKNRRKANFLKLEEAHFFTSPADDFIGPSDDVEESIANGALLNAYLPETAFNFSVYGPKDYYGKMQKAVALHTIENPDVQYQHSLFNTYRWSQFGSFSTANFFLAVYNNLNFCLPGNDQ
ncbi:hypothetical protein PI126_g5872 [Phytophthora idaei]|nr:hypothetical protein PI126_g5872 [Phytophthora idaei]